MKNILTWILRITLFLSLLMTGRSFGGRFHPNHSAAAPKAGQRTLLVVVKKLGYHSEVQSAWLIGRGINDSTYLIQIFPNLGELTNPNNYTQSTSKQVSEQDFIKYFDLTGFFNWWQVRSSFFEFLHDQGIMWDVYYVIDQHMVDEITLLAHVDPIEQVLTEPKILPPAELQSKLWKSICAHSVQLPAGLDLNLIEEKDGHYITDAPKGQWMLFAASPSIATCVGDQPVSNQITQKASNSLP